MQVFQQYVLAAVCFSCRLMEKSYIIGMPSFKRKTSFKRLGNETIVASLLHKSSPKRWSGRSTSPQTVFNLLMQILRFCESRDDQPMSMDSAPLVQPLQFFSESLAHFCFRPSDTEPMEIITKAIASLSGKNITMHCRSSTIEHFPNMIACNRHI